MKKTYHKVLSALLAAAMLLNMGLTPALADGTQDNLPKQIECHTQHDSDCGYAETVTSTDCTHVHSGDCGYTEGTPEQPCNFVPAADAAEAHSHDDACGYAPAAEGTPCTHSHDETCGYGETVTVTNPCTHRCEVCKPADQPIEKTCTCDPVLGEKEPGHGEACPLYVTPALSEALQALLAMVDALPDADAITDENREDAVTAFAPVMTAYEALSGEDKTAFEATGQYTKLMALQGVLFGMATMAAGGNVELWRNGKVVATYPDVDELLRDNKILLQSGDVMKLVGSITSDKCLEFPLNIVEPQPVLTLDLNGHTLTFVGGDGGKFNMTGNVILNVKNGIIKYPTTRDGMTSSGFNAADGATINLENVDIILDTGNFTVNGSTGISAAYGATVNAKNCTVNIFGWLYNKSKVAVEAVSGGVVNLTGGHYRADFAFFKQDDGSIRCSAVGNELLITEEAKGDAHRKADPDPGTELLNAYLTSGDTWLTCYARSNTLTTFSGKVTISGEATKLATITATDEKGYRQFETKSKADGSFQDKLQPGTYTVRVSIPGYDDITDTITVSGPFSKDYTFSQKNELTVWVVDKTSGFPLDDATVTIEKDSIKYPSNFGGNSFTATLPAAGDYTVSVSCSGFLTPAPQTVTFAPATEEKQTVSFSLERENLYNIFSADDLVKFLKAVNDGRNYDGEVVNLWADIDMSGVPYPLTTNSGVFCGTLEGNGHTIRNLTIAIGNNIAHRSAGLFKKTSGATIRNLGLVDCNITSENELVLMGGLVGSASNTVIENCFVTGTVRSLNADYTGGSPRAGLAGQVVGSASRIENCYSNIALRSNKIKFCDMQLADMQEGTLKTSYYTEESKSFAYNTRLGVNIIGVMRVTDPATISSYLNTNITRAGKEGVWKPWTQSDSAFPTFGSDGQTDTYTCKVGDKPFASLAGAIEYGLRNSDTVTVTMTADEILSNPIHIRSGGRVTVLVEGDCAIKRSSLAGAQGRMVLVDGEGSSLTLSGTGDGNSLTFDGMNKTATDAFFGMTNGGSLTIQDGVTITGMKRTGAGNAAAIYASDTSAVNIEGGKLSGNSIESVATSAASGVYLDGATLNLTGGRIEGNTGTGISAKDGSAVVNLSGSPVVKDNKGKDGVVRNLYLHQAANLTAAMQTGASVGVTFVTPPTGSSAVPFAQGQGYTVTDDDMACFVPDNKGYAIKKADNAFALYIHTQYPLTVNSGIGSGNYSEGEWVTITAQFPAPGQQFKEWTVISGGVTLQNKALSTTTFLMPATGVEITATYAEMPVSDAVCALIVGGKTTHYNTLALALEKVPTNKAPAVLLLTKDVTLDEPIEIKAGFNLTIAANGERTLTKGAGLTKSSMFTVIENGSLTLGSSGDSTGSGNHLTLDGTETTGKPCVTVKDASSTFTLEEDVTIQNFIVDTRFDRTSGVWANVGTVNLRGASFVNGNASHDIFVGNLGALNMSGKLSMRVLGLDCVATITGPLIVTTPIGIETFVRHTYNKPFLFARAGDGYVLQDSDLEALTASAYKGVYWNENGTGFVLDIAHLTADPALSAKGVYGTPLRDLTFENTAVKNRDINISGRWAFSNPSASSIYPKVGNTTAYTATFIPSGVGSFYALTVDIIPQITDFVLTEKPDYYDQSPNRAGWFKENIIYKVNNSWKIGLSDDPNDTSWADTITISEEGVHSLTYYIKKSIGGAIVKRTFDYKLDKTPPTLTDVIAPAGIYLTDTTARMAFTADDTGKYGYLVKAASDTPPAVWQILQSSSAEMKVGRHIIDLQNLANNTAYTLYIAAEDKASNQSAATVVNFTTRKVPLVGTVTLSNRSPKLGDTLTADTTGITSVGPGALSCQWYRDSDLIAGTTGTSYTVVADDVGKKLRVEVTAANCSGSLSSEQTATVAAVIDAPTKTGQTDAANTITADKTIGQIGDTVTYTVTFAEGVTPTLTLGGNHGTLSAPVRNGNTWVYTYILTAGDSRITAAVNFAPQAVASIAGEGVSIFADDTNNASETALKVYLDANAKVTATYDNGATAILAASYTLSTGRWSAKGGSYAYTATAGGKSCQVNVTVVPITASAATPGDINKVKEPVTGYPTHAAIGLPDSLRVTYSATGYPEKTETLAASWSPDVPVNFGKTATTTPQTFTGTVTLPAWATGTGTVSVQVNITDKKGIDGALTASIDGWTYGETAKTPTLAGYTADGTPIITYTYAGTANDGTSHTGAIPPQKAGNYTLKANYEDDTQIGSAVASFNVAAKSITPGLTVTGVSKVYDGNTGIVGDDPVITFTGAVPGDSPTAAATFAYDTASVGTNKQINATDIVLTVENNVNKNYTLSKTTASGIGAKITQAVPSATVPTGMHAITNTQKTLADVTFTQPSDGAWAWKAPATTLTADDNNQTQTFAAIFTPSDTVNYGKAEKDVPLKISEVVATFDSLDIKTIESENGTETISAEISVKGEPLPSTGDIALDKVVTWHNSCATIVSVTPNNNGNTYEATVAGLQKGISMVGIAVNGTPVSSVLVKYAPPGSGNSNNAAADIDSVADTIKQIVQNPNSMTPTEKAVVNAAADELRNLPTEAKKALAPETVETLDTLYEKSAGITTTQQVTADAGVQNPIDAGDVRIKGMAMASGTTGAAATVEIKQQTPTQTADGKKAAMEFSMRFTVNGTAQPLQSPLLITFPISADIHTEGMVIRHQKADDSTEEITHADSLSSGHYIIEGNQITMWVDSFSTFTLLVVNHSTPPSGGGGSGGGGGSQQDEYTFWMGVKDKIQAANQGDIVKATARGYDKMPVSVMKALQKNNGVTLVISWNGGRTITIPAGMAQQQEKGRFYYPLSLLEKLYADITFMETPPTSSGADRTGYIAYPDGKQIPVTGGSTLTVEALPVAPTVPEPITPPDKGFEQDAYANTPDAKAVASSDSTGPAVAAVLLAALCGGLWLWRRKYGTQ